MLGPGDLGAIYGFVFDSLESVDPELVRITLYAPADPPEWPSVVIGHACVDPKVVAAFEHRSGRTFQLRLENFDPRPVGMGADVPSEIEVTRILCEAVEARHPDFGGDWRIIVSSPEDRAKVANMEGKWRG